VADPLTGGAGHTAADGQVRRTTPAGAPVTAAGLTERAADARALAESLAARGVRAVAVTIVDNAGIARVKTVPLTGLEHATRWGLGLSSVFAVATVNDSFTTSRATGGPAGDLRLMPDPSALRVVAAQPGWAWAPASQYTQDGQIFGCCQRSFTQRMAVLASQSGLEIRVGSEIEWFLGHDEPGPPVPAHDGPGMAADGEAFLAGILAELPALAAVGAPSAASHLRLQPSRWAGAYACWGHENREAALRFITGMTGSRAEAANVEIKCFDQSANPYLAIGAVIAAGLSGIRHRLTLPPETTTDPATYQGPSRPEPPPQRLPETPGQALTALRRSEVIPAAMGPELYDAFTAVRAAEAEIFHGQDPETIAAAHRWRY
jgi:glutamine synthetase